MYRILRLLLTLLLIAFLASHLLTMYYSASCIVRGAQAAVITADGIYCQANENGTPYFFPLRSVDIPQVVPAFDPMRGADA